MPMKFIMQLANGISELVSTVASSLWLFFRCIVCISFFTLGLGVWCPSPVDVSMLLTWDALSYSARDKGTIQLLAAAKCDVNGRFMKQIKRLKSLLEKFAAAPRECACLQDGGRSRWWITDVCFIWLFCVIWVLTASIFVYVCFVDCCIAASLQTIK